MATPSHDSRHFVENECMIALILLCYVVPFQVALNAREKGSVFKGQFQLAPRVQVDSVPRMHQQPVGLAIAPLHLSRLSSLEVVNPKSVFKDGKQTFYGLKVMHYLKTSMSFHGWILCCSLVRYFVLVLGESRSHSQLRPNCQAGGAPPPSLTP